MDRRFVKQPNFNYKFCGTCVVTKEYYETPEVKPEDLFRWNNGTHVQDAFPYLSSGDREFIISGVSPKGWEEMFGTPGEEEEEVEEPAK